MPQKRPIIPKQKPKQSRGPIRKKEKQKEEQSGPSTRSHPPAHYAMHGRISRASLTEPRQRQHLADDIPIRIICEQRADNSVLLGEGLA